MFVIFSLLIIVGLVCAGYFISSGFYWVLAVVAGPILLGFVDLFQTKHAIKRNFPLVGRSRYLAEWMRPKLYQYFVEPDTEGAPIPRIFRSTIFAAPRLIARN